MIQCCYSPTDQMILITGSLGTHAHSGLHGERGGFLGHSMNFMVHGFTQKGVHFPCSLRFCEIIGSHQPGKSGEIYKNEVVRELSLFCQKVRELFLNADYLDIKKISWFSLEIFWDYHFMLQVKLLKKCRKCSGKFVSMSGKKSGNFFSDFWWEPMKWQKQNCININMIVCGQFSHHCH